MPICRICNNSSYNKVFTVRERMFGFRDEFQYLECTSCGCLQIEEYINDPSKYYPEKYYSFETKLKPKEKPIITFFRRQRSKYCLLGANTLWPLRSNKYGSFSWFKKSKVNLESSILDVGCGGGKLLRRMQRNGFTNLTGVDPYIQRSIVDKNEVAILKKSVFELNGRFDFIMAHHSFEHMQEPLAVLKRFYQLLKPDRFVLIRVPVVSSFAWRNYGVHWVALDAPRHLYLHSIKSFEILSKRAGFQLIDVVFDSTEFQFIGSELYLRDIPLKDSNAFSRSSKKSIFSQKQIEAYRQKANELNLKNDGDQACFYLYKQAA